MTMVVNDSFYLTQHRGRQSKPIGSHTSLSSESDVRRHWFPRNRRATGARSLLTCSLDNVIHGASGATETANQRPFSGASTVGNVSSLTSATRTIRRGKSPRAFRPGEFLHSWTTGGTSSIPDKAAFILIRK